MTLFNLQINNLVYTVDLSAQIRVAITRNLLALYSTYCEANPAKQISFDEYLTLVEKSPHPENQATEAPTEDELIDAEVLVLTEQIRRKDLMIDALLEAIARLK